MPADPLDPLLHSALQKREELSLDRHRIVAQHISATQVEIDGRRLVNFCANDYLGLARHPRIIAAMQRAAEEHGVGASASPLISGYTPTHLSAERTIAKWKGAEAAVLLPSGYQANHAAIQTLAGAAELTDRRIRFLLDKLVHASLIDAVRGSGHELRVFPHNGLTKLKRLLADADADETQVVVTESIFSMDGDAAPLAGFADLKRSHDFVLLVDEAHATGVYGPNGAGYASELQLSDIVDITILTLSKSLGVQGGAICSSKTFRDAVINFGRAYIYSTSISPALAAAAEEAINVLQTEPQRQQRARELARRVREKLRASGLSLPVGDSPIIPVIFGEEAAALAAAARLDSLGLLVHPIRPPTVPKGTSRLRVTLSCEHTDGEIDLLIQSLLRILRETS